MNKKFLSAILFGALMVTSTGTFVSCKDYDDEIEDLQSQIDNLATKSDVEAKLNQLQAALEAAKAESASNASKIAAIKQCQCDVDAMMAKIQNAVDADMKEYADEINALIKQAEEIVGKIADYVTSVELVAFSTVGEPLPLEVDFYTVVEKGNVFEENIAGAITFTEGKETQIAKDPILVRVSPANAVLEASMISLVNSKGQNLDEYVNVSVAKSNKLLSVVTRAAENNGLWEITVTLKNKAAFETISKVPSGDDEGKHILYAVQVNNTLSNAETRYITSSYDVVMKSWDFFKPTEVLSFTVDGEPIENINNRFDGNSNSLKKKDADAEMYAELVWASDAATEAILTGAKKNVDSAPNAAPTSISDVSDNRSGKDVALAVQGEPLTIAVADDYKDEVKAIYVTLDKQANAIESAPSEWNAWNGYSYTGLNKVVEGTSTTITINGKDPINDYIGFRVYAVNKDGTLVDPDGRAFYVLVGDQAQEITAVATSITPVSETWKNVATDAVAVEKLDEITGAVKWSWKVAGEGNQPFYLALADANGNAVKYDGTNDAIFMLTDGTEGNITSAMDWTKVKSVYALPSQEWYKYEDGKAYTGVLTLKTTTGHVLANLNVSFTKNIPTAAPEGLTIKTNQVVDGIYNCYLIPDSWTAPATTGTMAMSQIFNFPENTAANYTINFATSAYNSDDKAYTDVQPVAGNASVIVNKSLINNTTKHVTTATYNYGKISSEAKDKDDNIINYVVNVPEINFETIYNCIFNDTYTFDWATHAQLGLTPDADGNYPALPYKTAVTYGDTQFKVSTKHIFGTSAWDSNYDKFLSDNTSLTINEVALTSDANGVEEYFDVTVSGTDLVFTPQSGATNPTAAVPSTLTIKMKDMYGCDKVIELAITVNKR